MIIGYVEEFIPMEGNLRLPIMMHESFEDIKLISDLFEDWGVNASNFDGTAYRISQDGKYISGWTSGSAMFAAGWAIYLDDVFDSEEEEVEYCIPEYDEGCNWDDTISNVTLTGETVTLNNNSGCSPDGYGDYTDLNAPDLLAGETYNISVSTIADFPDELDILISIDYNNDVVFDNNEVIASTNFTGMNYSGTNNFNFDVPANATAGSFRMRVRMVWLPEFEIDPCDYEWYGETEDYTVQIISEVEPAVCDAPENIAFTNVTETSVEVSWDAGEGQNWEVVYGETGFDIETEGESTTTTESSLMIENLDANTTYDVYVRTICEDDLYSEWEGPANFTTDEEEPAEECLAPIDIEIDEITDTQAVVTWTPQGNEEAWIVTYGETGFTEEDDFEWELVTTTSFTMTELTPETTYDVYVVAVCDEEGNTLSEYSETVSFTTDEDMGVDAQIFAEFSFYPNPMENVVNLKAGVQIESVEIHNLLGQTIMTAEPNSLETQINTENLSSGVYLMSVQLNGNQKTFRLIKK